MASQVSLEKIDQHKDMLANIDALGQPTACARFMGGREFETICEKTGASLTDQFNESDLQNVINHEVFALPDFSKGSGPFGGKNGRIKGAVNNVSGIALASLYCALMIDYQLDMLGAKGDIFIEGTFLKNPLLCATLNQLRSEQTVFISNDATGTVQGAACLTQWDNKDFNLNTSKSKICELTNLINYKNKWRNLADSIN
ncbi:MAG: hypothetical protein JKY14_02530 [Paraglaciecola sp.]|nr:hypothetical protein [Paraglaciecola sp.]